MFKQAVCSKIGKSGCYFLSLVYIAETITKKDIDIFTLYEKGEKEKRLEFLERSFLILKRSVVPLPP